MQMLGYVLLDYDDEYEISDVMVYLPRQRCSWRVPLWQFVLPAADVILAMSRGTIEGVESDAEIKLKTLRRDFRRVAKSTN